MTIYSGLKIFHYHEKLASLTQDSDTITAPLHIRIKPTNVCNHNCSYCAYRSDNLQLGQNMDVRDSIPAGKMEEIVVDCIEMGVKAVTFSGGGEPFCYKYLEKTARDLVDGGVSVAALTNGALMKGSVAEAFAHLATWVRVSMDGWDGPSYARYRGVSEGEFTAVLENVENFQKIGGKCFLGVSYIINKENSEHVFAMARRLKDLGVNSVKLSPCITSNDGKENNRYHAPIFKQVKEQTTRCVEELGDDSFEVFDAYHVLDEKFDKGYSWCPYMQILPIIAADQRVYSCQDKAYNLDCGVLGSIKEQSFKQFWFADKSKFFEINPSRYNHHCVANSKNIMISDYLGANTDHLPFV